MPIGLHIYFSFSTVLLTVSLVLIINEAMILVYNMDVVLILMYIMRKYLIFMSLLVPVFIMNKVIL